jgi:hypothetical protein
MNKIYVLIHDRDADVYGLPDGYQIEAINLDAVADDPVSWFGGLSADAKEIVADEYSDLLLITDDGPESRCQNCGRQWSRSYLNQITHLSQRVRPGEHMPSGECPICGSLCQVVKS